MKITFVIDGISKQPSGGWKMIFKYAEYYAEKGHDVSILFAPKNFLLRMKKILPLSVRKSIVKRYALKGPRWYKLNSKITCLFSGSGINDNSVPEGDIVFATAVGTAKPVSELSTTKGKKMYLIQDYENWGISDEEVCDTYRLGMINICVSEWLANIVREESKIEPIIIKNPIDLNVFGIDVLPEKRNSHSIAMIYQLGEYKGFKEALI